MKTADLRDRLKNIIRAQVNNSLQLAFGIIGPNATEKSTADVIMKDLDSLTVHGHKAFKIAFVTTSTRNTKHVNAVRYAIQLSVTGHADQFGKQPIDVDGSTKLTVL